MIMPIGIELLNVRLSGLFSNDTRIEFGYMADILLNEYENGVTRLSIFTY